MANKYEQTKLHDLHCQAAEDGAVLVLQFERAVEVDGKEFVIPLERRHLVRLATMAVGAAVEQGLAGGNLIVPASLVPKLNRGL
jgi:hypothetical protein